MKIMKIMKLMKMKQINEFLIYNLLLILYEIKIKF